MDKTFVYKDFIESVPWWMLDQTLNMTPWVNIVWWWVKNAINWSKNMRIIRWIEFFEAIWIYPEFLKELEKSEQALDWLALCFEAYTKERTKEKRKILKNLFLWFTKLSEEEKEKFEIERLIDITNKITSAELTYLKHLNDDLLPLQDIAIDGDIYGSWYYHNNVRLEQPLTSFRKNLDESFEKYYDSLDIIWLRIIQNWLNSLNLIFSLNYKRNNSIEDYDFSDTVKHYNFTEIWIKFISYLLENES